MSAIDLGSKWVAKLAGLVFTNSAIVNGDTPLAALGKLQGQISNLSGGGAALSQTLLTLPYSGGGMSSVNVVNAAVTVNSKIVVSLSGTTENEAGDIDDWEVTATALAGSIDFNVSCPGPFCGQVLVNYMIG